jgi:enoyl-CoA hydratase/carnithine racemase
MNETPLVRLERNGGLAEIVLARSKRGNAVNLHLSQALRAVAGECAGFDRRNRRPRPAVQPGAVAP